MNFAPADLRGSERMLALGRLIDQQYEQATPILIASLDNTLFTLADIARSVTVPCEIDLLFVGGDDSDSYRFVHDLTRPLEGRHALLVLDTVDDVGRLLFTIAALNERRPASLAVIVYESVRPDIRHRLGATNLISVEAC